MNNLKGKKVLITAGPTWVPIDKVRVISNTATGETGVLLANKLTRQGARVKLLLGPVCSCHLNKKIKVIHFSFFDELKFLLTKELDGNPYDIVIQSAAISDYRPDVFRKDKISSRHKKLNLTLKSTPKIIDALRKLSPASYLVGFKFEPDLKKDALAKEGRLLLCKAKLDLVVANTQQGQNYTAYLLNKSRTFGPFISKQKMARALIGLIKK